MHLRLCYMDLRDFFKVRVIQKVSEVRFLDFLCYNMIAHGQKPHKKNLNFLISSFRTIVMVFLVFPIFAW